MSDITVISTTDTEEEVLTASGQAPEEKKVDEKKEPEGEKKEQKDPEENEETPDAPKKKGGFQKRIDRLTREKAELEARLAVLEKASTSAEELKQPVATDYDTQADYIAATIKYELAQSKKAEKAEVEKAKVQVEADAKQEGWKAQVDKAHKDHPELAELLENDLPVNSVVNEFLLDSEVGGELLFFLASHPEECERIAALGPIATAKAMTAIELNLTKQPEPKPKAPEPKVTAAKQPINPLNGGKGVTGHKHPDEMDLDEYRRWRESQS